MPDGILFIPGKFPNLLSYRPKLVLVLQLIDANPAHQHLHYHVVAGVKAVVQPLHQWT